MQNYTYVYILASSRNGTIYVGATTDLVARIWQHKTEVVHGFTSKHGVKKLVYYEMHESIESGFTRERQVKKWNRSWKIRMIEDMNPYWNDLYDFILK